jgi:hypothetical protein
VEIVLHNAQEAYPKMVIDIQVHVAPLVIIVHKRSGGDINPEVKYVIAVIQPFITTKWPPLSPCIITCHKNPTPANVEDLAALLYEMRENQDEQYYRKTNDRLAHLGRDHDAALHQILQAVSTRNCTTQTQGASTIARRRRRKSIHWG